MARSLRLLAAILFAAPTLAAAQDRQGSADARVLETYQQICIQGGEAPAGFEAVQWLSFPDALRLLNTYGHAGTFLRGELDGRTLYVARTSGAGHDSIVAAERRCGVAIKGANFDRLVRTLARQLRVRPLEMNMLGHKVAMLESPQGLLSINEADEGWIIVRAYDVSFR